MENKIERDVGFIRGPRFYSQDGKVMFTFGIDPNNLIGPRVATPTDKAAYKGLWEEFTASETAPEPETDFATPPKNKGGRPRKAATP